jgi:hypothetical protein
MPVLKNAASIIWSIARPVQKPAENVPKFANKWQPLFNQTWLSYLPCADAGQVAFK